MGPAPVKTVSVTATESPVALEPSATSAQSTALRHSVLDRPKAAKKHTGKRCRPPVAHFIANTASGGIRAKAVGRAAPPLLAERTLQGHRGW